MPIISSATSICRLFAAKRQERGYIFDRSELTRELSESDNIVIPLVIDTEFQSHLQNWTEVSQQGRFGITTQIRGIDEEAPRRIFEHSRVGLGRHPTAVSGFHPVDYLRSLGLDVSLKRVEQMPSPMLRVEFVLYAFFALAEAMTIVDGEYREDFKKLMQEKSSKKPRFEMTRRLMASTPTQRGHETDYVSLPWILTINGFDFAVDLCWIDACAIHGASSYAGFCEVAGIKLESKELLKQEDKEDMFRTYQEKPEDFDAYALGDLEVYDALEANKEKFEAIYESLGVKTSKTPKLTIGSTVNELFEVVLQNQLGVTAEEVKDFRKRYLEPASAGHLRQDPTSTKAIASKVEGGRCRSNRPLDVVKDSLLVDLDISGCYGEGQRNQMYPIGQPHTISFPAQSEFNQYPTLREFLKIWGKSLVPGGWFARASTETELQYKQDFLASWFVNGKADADLLAKYAANAKSDTEDEEEDQAFDEEIGSLKIFNHEILNGTLTSDFVDWLMNICSARQREELLDALKIKVAVYYDAADRVENWEELKSAYANHESRNKVSRSKTGKNQFEDGDCHAWIGLNIGKLLINSLLANRKMYPKKNLDNSKNPMNELFKLCINTLYGDMTSKYFKSANVVVGNNITARARALAWYMEKGLHGFQTITDGCAFEVNRVVYSRKSSQLRAEAFVNLYRENPDMGNFALRPLGGYDKIAAIWVDGFDDDGKPCKVHQVSLHKGDSVEVLNNKQADAWVNQAAMEHLQKTFPKVAVLHAESTNLISTKGEDGKPIVSFTPRVGQFTFEAKDWYSHGRFHGTSNYLLINAQHSNLKFRAYETKKIHQSASWDERKEDLIVTSRYGRKENPAKDFMKQLQNPEAVQRQVTFIKDAILKVSDYKNRFETWDSAKLVPGDSFYKSGLLREFSLSQFTFRTLAQYKAWDKAVTTAKDKQGQSIEQYFLNDDGTLNYLKMIQTIDSMIAKGTVKLLETLSRGRNDWKAFKHVEFDTYLKVRERLRDF